MASSYTKLHYYIVKGTRICYSVLLLHYREKLKDFPSNRFFFWRNLNHPEFTRVELENALGRSGELVFWQMRRNYSFDFPFVSLYGLLILHLNLFYGFLHFLSHGCRIEYCRYPHYGHLLSNSISSFYHIQDLCYHY